MAPDYRQRRAGSRGKPLFQSQAEINPVRHDGADEQGLQRGRVQPGPQSRQPTAIEGTVRYPDAEPKRRGDAAQEYQRIPAQAVKEGEAGTGLETTHSAAKWTGNAGQPLPAAKWQWKIPLDGKAGQRQQKKQPAKRPGRRPSARRFPARKYGRRRAHDFSPSRRGGPADWAFLDSIRMLMLLAKAQNIPARNTTSPTHAGRKCLHNSWKFSAMSGCVN